jgi:hypothetical protein
MTPFASCITVDAIPRIMMFGWAEVLPSAFRHVLTIGRYCLLTSSRGGKHGATNITLSIPSPPNYSSQLVAGHSPRPGLKPLFPPKRHGVAPFASRRAALPARTRGLATAE